LEISNGGLQVIPKERPRLLTGSIV